MKTPTFPDLPPPSADDPRCRRLTATVTAEAAPRVRGALYPTFISKRIKNGEMRPEGGRHVFSGSDSVERL